MYKVPGKTNIQSSKIQDLITRLLKQQTRFKARLLENS